MISDLFRAFGAYGEGTAPKVAFYKGDFFVSTISGVEDSEHPFETAVSHKQYYGGKWICVEEYDTLEDAKVGHEKWIGIMKNLPDNLVDVSTSAAFLDEDDVRGHANWRIRPRRRGRGE